MHRFFFIRALIQNNDGNLPQENSHQIRGGVGGYRWETSGGIGWIGMHEYRLI